MTDPPWCHARAGTEDSYRHTQTRPFVSPATIRFLVAASDDTHAPPGPVYPRSGAHSAPTPSTGSTRRHANTWPSHPPLTSTRPRVGTSTSSKRSTDHVCVCASTRAYRPSAHRRSVVAAAAKTRFAAAPRFERESSRRGGARWAVSRDSRRVRDVVGSNPGGGGSAAPRAARCRFQRCSASAAARHARHAEDAAARLLGGSARNTRSNTSPGRSKDAVALGSGRRSFESRSGVVDFFPGEERGVRGRGDAGVGERRGGGGVGERLGPVEGDALVPSRSGETETKTGGRLGAGRSERGGGGVGNNDAGRAKARRRGVEGGVVSGAASVDGGDDGAGGVDSATRSAGSATRDAIDAIDAIDRGAALDRSRWIDSGVGLFEASTSAPAAAPGSSSGRSRIGGARRRKPNAVAADDRSIAPVNAARDAAVRARSARMVAATRAAALDRERPREGNRVRTSPRRRRVFAGLPPRRGVAARAADDDREDPSRRSARPPPSPSPRWCRDGSYRDGSRPGSRR